MRIIIPYYNINKLPPARSQAFDHAFVGICFLLVFVYTFRLLVFACHQVLGPCGQIYECSSAIDSGLCAAIV